MGIVDVDEQSKRVIELRKNRISWKKIGEMLNISISRAHELAIYWKNREISINKEYLRMTEEKIHCETEQELLNACKVALKFTDHLGIEDRDALELISILTKAITKAENKE